MKRAEDSPVVEVAHAIGLAIRQTLDVRAEENGEPPWDYVLMVRGTAGGFSRAVATVASVPQHEAERITRKWLDALQETKS